MKLDFNELAPAALSLAAGIWLFSETFSTGMQLSQRVGGGLDAAGYPRLLAAAIIVLSLALIGRQLLLPRLRSPLAAEPAEPPAGRGTIISLIVFGVLLLYTLALQPLGYLLATPVLIVTLLLLIGERRPRAVLAMAFVLTAVIYVFFRYGISFILPEGVLGGVSF